MKLQRLEAIRKLYFSLPLVPRDCPLCGGKSGSLLVRRDRYFLPIDVVECTDCGFVHASRNLDREGARQFYTSIYPWLIYRRPRAEAEYDLQKREQAAFRWQRILARIDRPDSVFELGCGDGHFLAEARRLGISQLAAVEPDSSSRAHIIASLGPETDLWGDLSDVPQKPLKSQLIAMFHVLEHLDDPLAVLRQLATDFEGWLVIEVPDLLGDWSMLGIQNFHLSHRSYFTPASLRALLAKAGFTVLHEEREGWETGIYPGNLRVLARRDAAGGDIASPDRPNVAAHIDTILHPWSLRTGYPRCAVRLTRLALS